MQLKQGRVYSVPAKAKQAGSTDTLPRPRQVAQCARAQSASPSQGTCKPPDHLLLWFGIRVSLILKAVDVILHFLTKHAVLSLTDSPATRENKEQLTLGRLEATGSLYIDPDKGT